MNTESNASVDFFSKTANGRTANIPLLSHMAECNNCKVFWSETEVIHREENEIKRVVKETADMAFFGISLRKRHVDPGLFGHLSATRIPWSCKKKIIKAYRDATSARVLELNRASVRLWTILLGEGYRNHQRFRLWDTGRRQHFERNWYYGKESAKPVLSRRSCHSKTVKAGVVKSIIGNALKKSPSTWLSATIVRCFGRKRR
ncbi:hypothetical protein HPB47_004006 [Ixodes persulcatus]|uniref:Uncharacterized protein n=1 Tax=Ixodes persulcatus TaxID=34615 RepID=A0AC60PI93_IXOPE|nr:hypothetical protein HPB47_004006 [Ixodes persulcatus]